MKRLLSVILFIVILNPIFASEPIASEVSNAFVAVTDISYIAAANFISLQKVDYDSIAVRVSEETSLPEAILISNADLGTFLPYFSTPDNNTGFLGSFLPSLDPLVKARLVQNDWEKGEAIVTGVAAIVFPDNLNFQKILTDASSGIFPKVGLSFNFYIEGTLFNDKINIKGIFIVDSDSNGVPIITPIKLTINQIDYDSTFFERAPLLLTMKNDI